MSAFWLALWSSIGAARCGLIRRWGCSLRVSFYGRRSGSCANPRIFYWKDGPARCGSPKWRVPFWKFPGCRKYTTFTSGPWAWGITRFPATFAFPICTWRKARKFWPKFVPGFQTRLASSTQPCNLNALACRTLDTTCRNRSVRPRADPSSGFFPRRTSSAGHTNPHMKFHAYGTPLAETGQLFGERNRRTVGVIHLLRGLLIQLADREGTFTALAGDIRHLPVSDRKGHSKKNLAVAAHQNQLSQFWRRRRRSLRRCGLPRRGLRGRWPIRLWLRYHKDRCLLRRSRVVIRRGGIIR